MDRKDNRELILDAADRVLSRCGMVDATLEAVAAEAGLSKGGVLHYFGSKRDLLAGTLARFEKRFFGRRDEIAEQLPDTPCRIARATMMAIVDTRKTRGMAGHYRIDILQDLGFRNLIGQMKLRLYNDMFKGARNPEKMLVAFYLLDGLWLNRLFDPPLFPASIEAKARKWAEKKIGEYLDDF